MQMSISVALAERTFTVMTEHGRVNKYYAGTAVLMLPFFALSCLAAWLLGFPVDGYSVPFHVGHDALGALFIRHRGVGTCLAVGCGAGDSATE
jgi:hypothetical protein